MSTLRTVRQHLRFHLDGTWHDVHTRPVHYDLFARTRARHSWPDAQDNPVGFLVFVAWAAARDESKIPADLGFEKFRDTIGDIAELPGEPLDPTPPDPGAG